MPVKKTTETIHSSGSTTSSRFSWQNFIEGSLKNFGTFLLIAAAFLIGVLWTEVRYLKKGYVGPSPSAQTQEAQQAAPSKTNVTLDQIKQLFKDSHITFGDANKKLIFVEFSDPSCPYCHIAAGKNPELNKQVGSQFVMVADGGTYVAPVPEMKKLVDQGKASFIWIYTPGHGNGEMGTKALYCAHEKGKFWQVHDLLMTNAGYELLNSTVKNDKTKSGEIAEFLKSAISVNDMKSCLDSGKYDDHLTKDVEIARQLGSQGTPGFFVNTAFFNGAYSWKDLEPTATQALK